MMSLKPGTRLGPYEITALLGAGGMGEVYRARDTNLQRDVAVKVLPEDFAATAERVGRFRREAHMLAALNHPNIAAIHGIEDSGPRLALVMEFVEGPTLRERLSSGPLPVAEALLIAQQIALGLEYAHERGVIHRDLKPANIKITPEGRVKILDFGLGKTLGPRGTSSGGYISDDPALSPTLTDPPTRPGMLLGTPAYMSPEQARGRPVDRRADIWAFGCVLGEMLTGQVVFQGETTSDTLAALLKTEPDWRGLPKDLGPRLRGLLERCLRKDPGQRLRDIGDARLEIEAAIAAGPAAASGESAAGLADAGQPSLRQKIAWGTLGASLVALIAVTLALSGGWSRSLPQEMRPLRVSILHKEVSEVGAPAISPDGRRIAYRARRADGMPLLWVRDLDSFEARPLAGTEDGYQPFWSPDSRRLGFFAGLQLKLIPADGGPVRAIPAAQGSRGGAWAPDDTILFSRDTQLFRVSAAGGAPVPATALPDKDWAHYWPSFLPDGRRFLFTAKLWTRSAEASDQGIYLGSLDSPEVRRLLPDLSSAVYAPPGYIVFARDGNLMAVPFDPDTGLLTGEPTAVGEAAAIGSSFYQAAVSAAADGTLATLTRSACAPEAWDGTARCDMELRLLDRGGRVLSVSTPGRHAYFMDLAPDGRRVAAQIADPRTGTNGLYLVDMLSGGRTPLTTNSAFAGHPAWSPDGSRLAYAYQPPGGRDEVHVKDLRAGRDTLIVANPTAACHPVAWSHDGASLLVRTWPGGLFIWSFTTRALTPFVQDAEPWAWFSPDDRYVAFSSVESGRYEVYVTTFPGRSQTWPLTTEGGTVVGWRADGREILVATLSGHIAAYPVSTEGGSFSAGQPTILVHDVGFAASYSRATADHSRILVRTIPETTRDRGEIHLLLGWARGLRKN